MPRNEQRFSLKDHLFNKQKVAKIASEIAKVYSQFDSKSFQNQVLEKFPELELMERVYWIRDSLRTYLPNDYRKAVSILLTSLPPESDPTKTDDDFGDFIYAPYSYFVAEYGCTKKDFAFSLDALEEMTTRFSAEGPIRFFINAFPKETLEKMLRWTTHHHYHVRRLASEGSRPSLPWAKKITIPYTKTFPILSALYSDETRFVTRSVANHLNDISKIDVSATVKLLQQWQRTNRQDQKEMQYIMNHSLRTLVKDGNKSALILLGYTGNKIEVKKFNIATPNVVIGESLVFSFDIHSLDTDSQSLMIDYVLYFKKANGALSSKTFKIAKKILKAGEILSIEKVHPLKRMTTRKLYAGAHAVELQVNGTKFEKKTFQLAVTR